MGKIDFKVVKEQGNARLGEMTLNNVTVQTPVFMPVGTKATIKGLVLDMLQDPRYIGDIEPIKLILANTFHLYLRPGEQLIQQAGGLHRFANWDGLFLTDSGGFQVFSLGLGKSESSHGDNQHAVGVQLHPNGVSFRSPHDGSKHFFSPTGVVDIQCALGSDIMMMLDVCSPADSDKQTTAAQMKLTHAWAREQYDYVNNEHPDRRGVLFPIVQGGFFEDLREESIAALTPFASDGIAIGGVSVGETEEEKKHMMDFCGHRLPADKPRYIMGIGTPADVLYAAQSGFDMFDCVLATRLGRHGVAFGVHNEEGEHDRLQIMQATTLGQQTIKLRNSQYKSDLRPLQKHCPCHVCKSYSRAYLHHLVREKEQLGGVLLSLHNIVYLHWLLRERKRSFS